MDTSTPVRNQKQTCCRISTKLYSQPILEESEECSNPSDDSVLFETQTPSSSLDHTIKLNPKDLSANLNKSEELFPFSPIPLRQNIPPTLLPLLDTPDLKFSSSILTPYSCKNESLALLLPENTDCHDGTCSKSYFQSLEEMDHRHESTLDENSQSKEKIQHTSPILNCSQASRSRRSARTVTKKLFAIPEEDPGTDFSYQVMGDLTMDAAERICQVSETLYSDAIGGTSSNVGQNDFTSVSYSLNTEGNTEIGVFSGEVYFPPTVPHIDKNDIDSIFKTQFDFLDIRKNEDSLNKKKFVYPVNSVNLGKSNDIVNVKEVFESVIPLEYCDHICIKKPKLAPRELICFSQLSSENVLLLDAEQIVPEKKIRINKYTNRGSNYPKFVYLIQIFRENKELGFYLRKFFEIIRIDFVRLISNSSLREVMQEVLILLNPTRVSKFLNNQEINVRLCQLLRQAQVCQLQLMREFFVFFYYNSHLVVNGYKIRTLFNAVSIRPKIKRKMNQLKKTSRRQKVYNNVGNQLVLGGQNSLIDFSYSDFAADSQVLLFLEKSVSVSDLGESHKGKNINTGFCTAHGHDINIHSESLDYCKKLLESIPEDAFYDSPESKTLLAVSEQKKIDEVELKASENFSHTIHQEIDSSFNLHHENKFNGFSTASGHLLKVSKTALKKAGKFFDSVNEEGDFSIKSISDHKFKGFSTASGNSLKPSEAAMKGAVEVFNHVFEQNESCLNLNFDCVLKGFGTVSGNSSKVSSATMKEAVKFSKSINEKNDFSINSIPNDKFTGFCTASGNSLKSSEAALKKAGKIFDSIDKESELFEKPKSDDSFKELKTISGNSSKESSATMKEAIKFPKSINEEKDFSLISISGDKFTRFCTASGNSLKPSEAALKKAGKILDSIDKESELFEKRKSDDSFKESKTISRNSSRSSTVTLKETKNNLDSDHQEKDPCITSNSNEMLKGFSTASGNSLTVSKLALKKAEQIFKSVDHDSVIRTDCCQSTDFEPPLKLSQELFEEDASLRPPNANSEFRDTKQIVEEATNIDMELFSASDFSILNNASKSNYGDESSKNDDQSCNKEVSESTSAFLQDEITSTSTGSKLDAPGHSKPSSPIFGTRKLSQHRNPRKRKTQYNLTNSNLTPLNVTYSSKEEESGMSDKFSSGEMLEKFKNNFAQKAGKRKEAASVLPTPQPKRIKDVECKNEVNQQQKYIENKPNDNRQPRDGWFTKMRKQKNTIAFKEAVSDDKPHQFSALELIRFGVKSSVLAVISKNASKFKFSSEFFPKNYDDELIYGDDCRIIPNDENEVEFKDLSRAFLASPGVDPKLISEQWIKNHYRWIVWKLAAVEKSFPERFGGRYLTVDNVLFQLKYRYDREIDKCQRSALKRILECDDTPSKAIILCVADVRNVSDSENEYELELTDGWYSVIAQIDPEMNNIIVKKKINIGAKVLIMNSELVGLSDGCDPLQVDEKVRLKVFTNSTRRVRWDTQLGFFNQTTVPIIHDLKTVLPKGGISFPITAVISRIYPILYREKNENGAFSEIYNEKVELKRATEYEQKKQACYDKIVSQVIEEVLKENNIGDMDYTEGMKVHKLDDRERINSIIRDRIEQRLPENFRDRRKVSALLKVRIVNDDDEYPARTAVLTIWNPSEDILSIIKEGRLCTFYNLRASDTRNNELSLSSTRMTRLDIQNAAPKSSRYFRKFTAFTELQSNFTPAFNEIDIVGVIINGDITDGHDESDRHTIYLADLDMNFVVVKFSSSIENFGFEDVLKHKRIVAGVNLQWRRGMHFWNVPVLFASECTTFMQKSKIQHLQDRLNTFENFFKKEKVDNLVLKCEEKLKSIINSSAVNSNATTPKNMLVTSTPVKYSNRGESSLRNAEISNSSMYLGDQSGNSSTHLPEMFNKSSNSRKVKSRMDKLLMYPEPPPLSPISMEAPPKRARLSILTRSYNRKLSK